MRDNEQNAKSDNVINSEREQQVAVRRARQRGSSRAANMKLIVTGALLLTGGLLVVAIAGPSAALQIFGVTPVETQRTSQIDLKVDKEANEPVKLDFVVPADPVIEKPEEDPNRALNEKLRALQEQIALMERNRQPGVSNEQIKKMLSDYNASVARQLETQRKEMAEENARLKAEADQANELRRRAEEVARQQEESLKQMKDLDQKQRESDAVIVDEGEDDVPLDDDRETGDLSEELDRNKRFLKANADSVVETSVSEDLTEPSSMVVQGTIISAVLETAIDTSLPGSLRAQITEPVYSFDGSRIMMPEGTILIGEFNNDVKLEQKRVMIAWNRAVTPEGKSIALGSIGTDRLGRSGTLGNVDNRYFKKFGAAALISTITAVPTLLEASGGDSDSENGSGTNVTINPGAEAAGEIGNGIGGQASEVLGEYLSLPPIIRVPQGEEIRIFVNRDLLFT
ncbi:type IV secretion system VirB10/TraB/TrbI protein (plasmid) [Rhizobium etli 8C-3]|uniref:Type IV secretion system VirB10/TraB/TrbI protein n=1 Tax=Rhizobium etli 8C-3 TaxID=538025 RepID=A0A1L5PAP3_RHIET|nr:TrbI/VirB10 family protein [Rhizobium etli]APO77136.1 type IV secretion system VirB10/TraB/TrbI protein [Rhizobium etli 8C-3]